MQGEKTKPGQLRVEKLESREVLSAVGVDTPPIVGLPGGTGGDVILFGGGTVPEGETKMPDYGLPTNLVAFGNEPSTLTLSGISDADSILGGAGNDTIDGGSGNDII